MKADYCLTPFCRMKRKTRGVCGSCHRQIRKKVKDGGQDVEHALIDLGIMLPEHTTGSPYGEAVSLDLLYYTGWLPFSAKRKLRGQSLGELKRQRGKGNGILSLSLDGFPHRATVPFVNKTESELRSIAANPTHWSPGTEERKIVYMLRLYFGVAERGIFFDGDHKEAGTGTLSVYRQFAMPKTYHSFDNGGEYE
jgi:hypothetical protein